MSRITLCANSAQPALLGEHLVELRDANPVPVPQVVLATPAV